MKKINDLKNYYTSDLVPVLDRIDRLRANVRVQMVSSAIISLIFFPLVAWFLVREINDTMVMLYFIPIFALLAIGAFMVFESIIENTPFYKQYKRDVIYHLIKFINPSLHYDRQRYVNREEFANSKFFKDEVVDYDGDDHVTGNIDDVDIEFSELEVQYRSAGDRNKYKTKYQFRGIFFVALCPRPFPADMIIEPKKLHNETGSIFLSVEDARFNSFFQVRLPNEDYVHQATEMLSTDFVNKLSNFREAIHNPLHLSFVYDKMYVAIEHEKELFEPSVWKPAKNFDDIFQHFRDLYYPISIIEHVAAHREFEEMEIPQNGKTAANA